LKVDTIFSLWLPLRFTLREIHGYNLYIPDKVKEREKYIDFLGELGGNSSNYFPLDNSLVENLARLFELGIKRENVMILPDRIIKCKRGSKPYYDYRPHFLYDCFQGGNFSKYFSNNNVELKKWIETQHLHMFFEDESVKKLEVKDLSGSVQNNKPKKVEVVLDNYIIVLEVRGKFY
jgi:hypothetical protein